MPFSQAPKESQQVIRDFGRVDYVVWGLDRPHAQPLTAQLMVKAFRIWDEEIGARH